MNIIDIIEILKIVCVGYLVIDASAFMYVWLWKEAHYGFHILLFYIPLTGVLLILSDYKEMLRELDSVRGGII
jgi:uncharacterized membrane protein YagU involved in acid resistance